MERSSNHPIWTLNLADEVRQHLNNESSGHDPWHAFRVRQLGAQIALAIGADTDVVEAAALLHDIGHAAGRAEHAQRGAALAAEVLSRSGFPVDKIGAVTACIEHHHWQPGRTGDPLRPTLEYQAFADADRLDALGAIGIARAFAFGGAHDRPIWSPAANATAGPYGASSVHHFYDKLLRLPGDMYTDMGRDLAAHRVALMQEFLGTFFAEWECRDAGPMVAAPPSLSALSERAVEIGDGRGHLASAILQADPIN